MKVWIENMKVNVLVKYDSSILERFKKIGSCYWNSERKLWQFPLEKYDELSKFRNEYMGVIVGKNFLNLEDSVKTLRLHLVKKGYSPKTIKNYSNHLKRFLIYGNGKYDVETVNCYLVNLIEGEKVSHTYCNQAISAIKIYLKLYGGDVNGDFIHIERPKKEKKIPKVLSQQEVKKIFDVTDNIKHKTVFMLAYSCGLRVSEVINFKLSDIDSDRMVVIIKQSKGRKDRISTLSIKMLEQLREYYSEYRPLEWLFENPIKNGPMSPRTLQRVFNNSVEKAEIRKLVTFHSLRHSFATHLLDSGVDIRYIQELLGHASCKTTEIYTHVSTRALQNIINPLDRL